MTDDRRRRRRAWVAIGMCGAAVVAIVVLAVVLSENVVYFRTVSEAVERREEQVEFPITQTYPAYYYLLSLPARPQIPELEHPVDYQHM